VAFVAALGLLAFVEVVGQRATGVLAETERLVGRTHATLTKVRQLEAALLDAEDARRGATRSPVTKHSFRASSAHVANCQSCEPTWRATSRPIPSSARGSRSFHR
jgi:hypothetical protein